MEGQVEVESLIASLREHGVEETVIASAVAEARADAYPNKRK
jgi:hypothetical protein